MERSIPRHEPEVLAANAARRPEADPARLPDTGLSSLVVNGILLTSRYRRAEEFAALAEMAGTLPHYLAFDVDSLHCDSKVGWAFQAVLADWSEELACKVAAALEAVSLAQRGGHGGIWVVPAADLRIAACLDVDARWDALA